MKLLFYTTWDLSHEKADGIAKKIRSQIQVFMDRGYSVSYTYMKDGKVFLQCEDNILCLGRTGSARKFTANYHISKMLRDNLFDFAYIRYSFADYYFIQSLKRLGKNHTKILLEIPTYPYEKELHVNLGYKIILLLDKCYRNKMRHYVDRVVTYTDDQEIYGIPAIRTVNGITMKSIRKRDPEAALPGIHLIAVAGLAIWHAYDRVLKGMALYYARGGRENLIFHLVGNGPVLLEYKELVKQLKLQERVIFYGFLDGRELDEVYDKCSIAVSILGLHRRGCSKDTSLKAAEYGAKGLPIISTYDVESYPQGRKYQLIVSNDDSPIDIQRVIDFYEQVGNKKETAERIRSVTGKNRDMECTFRDIFDYFENNYNKSEEKNEQ